MKFKGLKAIFINCTLKKSPQLSHTRRLIDVSVKIMKDEGDDVSRLRLVDHNIAFGVQPDMTKHGHKK